MARITTRGMIGKSGFFRLGGDERGGGEDEYGRARERDWWGGS